MVFLAQMRRRVNSNLCVVNALILILAGSFTSMHIGNPLAMRSHIRYPHRLVLRAQLWPFECTIVFKIS